MKKVTIFCCMLLATAALQSQNVLLPGAFTRKLGIDASKIRKIKPGSISDVSPNRQVAMKPSGRTVNLTPDSTIIEMMNQVDTSLLRQTVQHLQDYGTRYAYLPQADSAGDWIYKKLDSINNLSVVKQYFPLPNGDTGFNVIATLSGTKYPDEYVIMGAHYDSWAPDSTNAPGANDDGVGTAGVMEAARIMSQYSFDRSIIFACWTMEEINLGGSGYFASQAADSNMKILGFISLDVGGYLKPGNQPSTFIMHQPSSEWLVDFYAETCGIYLPEFQMYHGNWYTSDNWSFSLNGYQGIWNCEDVNALSQWNHTPNDKIGINVNSFYNLGVFVKAGIANLASMAESEPRPLNLRGFPDDIKITLIWSPNDSVDHYNIYRDSMIYATSIDTSYLDINVTNGIYYSYHVTSVFSGSNIESEGSSPVRIKPRPPLTFPFTDDFENGTMFWELEEPWGLENQGINQSWCLSDSPGSNYENATNVMADVGPLDLTGCTDAEVSFMTNYNLENNYDWCYLFVFDNSLVFLDALTGNQPNWIQRTSSLNDFLGKPDVHLFFLLITDIIIIRDGVYIDNFTISMTVGTPESGKEDASNTFKVFPNPFSDPTTIEYVLAHDENVFLTIYDYLGKEVEVVLNKFQAKGKHQAHWNAGNLPAGMYYYRIQAGTQVGSGKLVKN